MYLFFLTAATLLILSSAATPHKSSPFSKDRQLVKNATNRIPLRLTEHDIRELEKLPSTSTTATTTKKATRRRKTTTAQPTSLVPDKPIDTSAKPSSTTIEPSITSEPTQPTLSTIEDTTSETSNPDDTTTPDAGGESAEGQSDKEDKCSNACTIKLCPKPNCILQKPKIACNSNRCDILRQPMISCTRSKCAVATKPLMTCMGRRCTVVQQPRLACPSAPCSISRHPQLSCSSQSCTLFEPQFMPNRLAQMACAGQRCSQHQLPCFSSPCARILQPQYPCSSSSCVLPLQNPRYEPHQYLHFGRPQPCMSGRCPSNGPPRAPFYNHPIQHHPSPCPCASSNTLKDKIVNDDCGSGRTGPRIPPPVPRPPMDCRPPTALPMPDPTIASPAAPVDLIREEFPPSSGSAAAFSTLCSLLFLLLCLPFP